MGQQKLQIVLSAMECVKRASGKAFSEVKFTLRRPGEAPTIRVSQEFNLNLSSASRFKTKSRVFDVHFSASLQGGGK